MSLLLPMFIYAFSMAITPGPNNIIVLSAGVNHGFKRAMPFSLGVVIGFNILLATIGFGVGAVLASNQAFLEVLSYAGIGFILYMAYKIATAPTTMNTDHGDEAGFLHGVLFQWINPKAWTACLGGVAAFNLAGNQAGMISYIVISAVVVFFALCVWAYAGSKIARILASEQNHRIFNYVMGGSLMMLAFYLLLGDLGL